MRPHCRAAASVLVLVLVGCAAELPSQPRLQADDCLREVKLKALDQAIRRCDRVVAAFPRDPGPRNDRFLLHTLQGNSSAACRDIAQAQALARTMPAERLSLQLRTDLTVRLQSCR